MARFPVVGITGGVGCGKSEAGRVLAGLGVAVVDADAVAHDLMKPGALLNEWIARRFGSSVVAADGTIRRPALAALVFADAEARRELEAKTHPAVLKTIRVWREEGEGSGAALIPLLFEAGITEGWSEIWCVSADAELVRERLKARGWDAASVAARQAAQWPLEKKEEQANLVLRNDDSREAFADAVRNAWMKLVKRSHEHVR